MQLAFVTMGSGGGPVTAKALCDAWRTLWPKEEPITDVEGADGALTLSLLGGTGILGFMPVAVPWSDLEGPAACAWHWSDATAVLKAHESHLVVGVTGEEAPSLSEAIRLTLLTAAVCVAASDATGVCWGEGTAVSPADRFVDLAREMTPESYPLLAWVEFRVFPDDGGSRWSVFTTGLRALGSLEIEVRNSTRNPSDLIENVMDIAGYVLHTSAVLNDGDTIGSSADEKMQIHRVPSEWEREGPVLCINM